MITLRKCLATLAFLGGASLVHADTSHVEFLNAGTLPPDLPFSEAVRVGDTYYLSGQIGIEPGTRNLASGGLDGQARQTMANIQRILEGNGLGLKNLVKCTVMLDDMDDWPAFNKIYMEILKPPYPARSAFGADDLALEAKVEVECIAAKR